jgi:hypothetical protein
MNETHQLLIYADHFSLLDETINIMKRNWEPLLDASKEIGQDVNEQKTEYMLMSRHQNKSQNHKINPSEQILNIWEWQ